MKYKSIFSAIWTAAVVSVSAAFGQGANTAYVPFLVNVDAVVSARLDRYVVSVSVKKDSTAILAVPLGNSNSVWLTGGARGRPDVPAITGSRGNITLRLPAQSYRHAEIALHSVSGRRVLRGKAAASETANAISRKNVAAGVYLLSVKGVNGSAFTTRLTHSGGNLNINAVFGSESVSHGQRLAKSAAEEWMIAVSADGYVNYTYMLNLKSGTDNDTQVIDMSRPIQTFTVMFSSNGGTGAVPDSQTVYAGAPIRLPGGDALANDGFTFGGWCAKDDGTDTVYNVNSYYTPVSSITLYAKWNAEAVQPPVPTPVVADFVDSRDNTTYKKVTIGAQTWMAENLNYDDPNVTTDMCYNNSADNCKKYGRLYDWYTAMGGAPSSSAFPNGVRGVCPAGWHIPSDAEWTELTNYVGLSAGTKLKSSTDWKDYDGVPAGTDEYGFSALPGGGGLSGGDFSTAGNFSFWWSATDYDDGIAYGRGMNYDNEDVAIYNLGKTRLFSVRCVQN